MISATVQYPDGRKDKKNVITAYKVVNGADYIAFDTGSLDNGNKVVGVSYKPAGEERFQKIVDTEEWKKAKSILVDDLHDKKDAFVYAFPEGEQLVTEDFMHNLALRTENLDKLVANYEEFLKSKQVEETAEIKPLASQEIPAATIAEFPQTIQEFSTITPNPIVEPIIKDIPSAIPTPEIIQNPSVAFSGIEKPSIVEETQNQIVNTPVIEPTPENNNLVNLPEQEVQNNNSSSVENAYIENIDTLIKQMKKISDEYIKQMEHMKAVSLEEFKQIKELRKLAEDTVKRAESVMANSNNNYNEQEQILSKVA